MKYMQVSAQGFWAQFRTDGSKFERGLGQVRDEGEWWVRTYLIRGELPTAIMNRNRKKERAKAGGTNLANTTHENKSICLKKRKKYLRGISRPLNVIINIGWIEVEPDCNYAK